MSPEWSLASGGVVAVPAEIPSGAGGVGAVGLVDFDIRLSFSMECGLGKELSR